MESQMTISTISDETYDGVFIYKLFSNPVLLESLKQIERPELFTAIEEFFTYDLKVCTFLLLTKSLTFFKLLITI